jgi:hypothetical protein
MKILTLILLLFSVNIIMYSQKTLIVDKIGRGKHLEYNRDDNITFFTGDPQFKTTGIITAISDSTVTINGTFTVAIHEITRIRLTRNFLYGGKYYLFASSAVYPAIGIVNHALNKEKLTDKSMLTYPAVLVSAGILARIFQFHDIKPGKKWKLKVVEFKPVEKGIEQDQ